MASVAFAFGSFGDIVAAISLVCKLTRTLHEGNNAADYEGLIDELTGLESILQNLKRLITTQGPSLLERSSMNAIEIAVQRCRTLIEEFINRTQGYASGLWGLWRKMDWVIFKKGAALELKTELMQQRTAIILVLSLATCVTIHRRDDRVRELRNTRESITENLFTEVRPPQYQDIMGNSLRKPEDTSSDPYAGSTITKRQSPLPLNPASNNSSLVVRQSPTPVQNRDSAATWRHRAGLQNFNGFAPLGDATSLPLDRSNSNPPSQQSGEQGSRINQYYPGFMSPPVLQSGLPSPLASPFAQTVPYVLPSNYLSNPFVPASAGPGRLPNNFPSVSPSSRVPLASSQGYVPYISGYGDAPQSPLSSPDSEIHTFDLVQPPRSTLHETRRSN